MAAEYRKWRFTTASSARLNKRYLYLYVWETGLAYPETEKLLVLCDILDVNLDFLLRDISDTPHADKKQEQVSSYASYIGKWLRVFLKDREFNGFSCVGLIAIQNTELLFMDEKCKAVFTDMTSICTISELTDGKQTKKLPMIPAGAAISNIYDSFVGKKCDIKLKQEQPVFGFNKPGGFYSVWVARISDEAVIAQDRKGNQHMIPRSDVLFIRECP